MSPIPTIVQAAARSFAAVRLRASGGELHTVIPAACGDAWARVRAHGVENPGRLVAVYLDRTINIEVGVEVPVTFAGFEDLPRSATPAGRVATAAHLGSYHRLGDTHAAILEFCKANGHVLAGPSWEIYGHWTDDQSKLRTDIFYLLQEPR